MRSHVLLRVSPPQTSIPCAGLTVADFVDQEPINVTTGATVTLVRCSFTRNREQIEESRSHAVIGAYVWNAEPVEQRIVIVLQQCTFKDNHAYYPVLKFSRLRSTREDFAVIYSDDPALTVLEISVGGQEYTAKSPEPLSAVSADGFGINCSSVWLQRVQQVRSSSLPCTRHVWLLLRQSFVHALGVCP
jgi:hypothetical protein